MKAHYVTLSLIIVVCTAILDFSKAEAEDEVSTKPVTDVCFVISARKLPDTDDMGMGAPDPYVMIEYSASPTDGRPYRTNTTVLDNNHNPDWPEIYHISYHPGRGQLLTFNIFDHNTITKDVKIGSVSVSLGEMAKSSKRRVEYDIVGAERDPGKLVLFMKINGTILEDTERRLRNKYAKLIHIGGHYQVKYIED